MTSPLASRITTSGTRMGVTITGTHSRSKRAEFKAELEAGGDAVRDLCKNDARHGAYLQYPGLPL